MNIRKKRWKAKPIKIRRRSAQKNLRETRPRRKVKAGRAIGGIFKKLFLVCIVLFFIGLASLIALFVVYSQNLPDVKQLKINSLIIAQTTKIFDRTGTHLLYTIHGEEDRTSIPLADIPDYVKWATLAVEDKNFYSRELAIDINGVGRALSAPGGRRLL
jgi:membrane carboxypeptidase/penicillin-binding protein